MNTRTLLLLLLILLLAGVIPTNGYGAGIAAPGALFLIIILILIFA